MAAFLRLLILTIKPIKFKPKIVFPPMNCAAKIPSFIF